MAESSLSNNMEITHEMSLDQTWEVETGGGGSDTYVVYLPRVLTLVVCTVEWLPARGQKLGRLREHFMYRHWKAQVSILQGGGVPPDTVPKIWHSHTRSVAGTAPTDNQVQPGDGDVTAIEIHGAGSEGRRDGV